MQGGSQLYIALKGRLTWTQAKLDGRMQPDSAQFDATRPPTIDHSFLAASGRSPRLGALQRIACWSAAASQICFAAGAPPPPAPPPFPAVFQSGRRNYARPHRALHMAVRAKA